LPLQAPLKHACGYYGEEKACQHRHSMVFVVDEIKDLLEIKNVFLSGPSETA
jgi:hypothetical protein